MTDERDTAERRSAASRGSAEASGELTLVLRDDDARSVARARRFVVEHLTASGLGSLAGDGELVVSELVTNALLHAGPPVLVVVRPAHPRARIEVHDSSPVMPLPLHAGEEAMTGRGLHIAGSLTRAWGAAPLNGGKCMWAELELGTTTTTGTGRELDSDALIALWTDKVRAEDAGEPLHTVRLGDVPTSLLLTAKSHVDDLVREFTLAASGAASGMTGEVPPALAALIEAVVHGFADARESIRRQAIIARSNGEGHVTLELRLPASAADAGEAYLQALDEVDAYCRAARLLTLETPPRHRIFRQWYVEELVSQLRRAAAGSSAGPSETFEDRLLREVDAMAETERRAMRAARLHELSIRLSAALTPEAVAETALEASVAVLGASGGAVLLSANARMLAVPATLGYDPGLVTSIKGESPAAELPAATALRSGEEVWLESPDERDARFPELTGLEPRTVSMAAVPLRVGDRLLGALRFSFTESKLFDDDERSFVRAIAAQTAQAVDRAQLSAARDDAARRLQRSLLPPELPTVPELEISAAYHPVTASLEVGGDFYDMWACGDGRLAVAMGDVCGHGPEAAATTALIRHTLRALTLTSSDVLSVLGRLDAALKEALAATDRFATVVFGFLTFTSGECRLDLATGGHAGPVVFGSDGTARAVPFSGSLLGILDDPEFDLRRITLHPGDEVVLVTDGVTEARDDRGAWFGVDGLVSAVQDTAVADVPTAERVSRAVLAHGSGQLQDDVAVLALRWSGD